MRRKHVFYALLALATVGLSELLAAWRAWRAAPTLDTGAAVVGLGCGLLALMLWLGFLLYEVDRAAGRIRRPVRLYEWVLERRGAGRPRAWTPSARTAGGGGRGAS